MQKGIVKEITDKDTAVVSFGKGSDCEKCTHRCYGIAKKESWGKVENNIGAKVGDCVFVEIDSWKILRNIIGLYLPPVVLIFIGYYFGSFIGKKFEFDPQLTGVLFSALYVILGFVIALLVIGRRSEPMGRIKEIIKKKDFALFNYN